VITLLTKAEQALSFGLPHIDHAFPCFRVGEFAVLYGHQFCKTLTFMLSVRCQLPKELGGFNSSCVYVDGGNTFNPYTISAVAQQHGLDPKSALERIFVSRAFTAYQLSALILETLEKALKQHRSRLVLISDVMSLFLDRDVPTREALDIFKKALSYVSELAEQREVIIVASYFPQGHLRRRFFLESALFGRAGSIIKVEEIKGVRLQFSLEKHLALKPLTLDVSLNADTLEKFVEV